MRFNVFYIEEYFGCTEKQVLTQKILKKWENEGFLGNITPEFSQKLKKMFKYIPTPLIKQNAI
jgi:hypothetical protein